MPAEVKELIAEWRRQKKIRVGIMAVLQLHGRAGNRNPTQSNTIRHFLGPSFVLVHAYLFVMQ